MIKEAVALARFLMIRSKTFLKNKLKKNKINKINIIMLINKINNWFLKTKTSCFATALKRVY